MISKSKGSSNKRTVLYFQFILMASLFLILVLFFVKVKDAKSNVLMTKKSKSIPVHQVSKVPNN